MSSYFKDSTFLKQYAERTLINLGVIEKQAMTEKNSAFEVTELINSLLALVVFPQEINLLLQTNKFWDTTFRKYIVHSSIVNIGSDEILKQLRNAISHSHILFEQDNLPDRDGNAQIGAVIFVSCKFAKGKSQCPKGSNCWNCKLKNNNNKSDKPDLQITIPVNELRNCVTSLASEIIKSVNAQNTSTKHSIK